MRASTLSSRAVMRGSTMAACVAIGASFALGSPVAAQGAGAAWPTKPVRIIVTTPSGSGGDFVMRTLAQALSEHYGQQVTVENRPGAGGLIGAGAIAAAAPDGYTLGLASTAHVVAPMLQQKPPYRAIEDFTPVVQVGNLTNVVIVGPSVKEATLGAFVATMKARPGHFNFLSLGDGTAAHLAAEIFNRAAGVDVVHVPFKTVADANTAIISGDVHYGVFLVPPSMPLIKGGKVRPLAVTSRARIAALPDVPTVVEAGLPDAASDALLGIVGPAGIAPDLATRIHADVVAQLRKAEVRDRLATQAVATTPDLTPADYARNLRADRDQYARLIGVLGLRKN